MFSLKQFLKQRSTSDGSPPQALTAKDRAFIKREAGCQPMWMRTCGKGLKESIRRTRVKKQSHWATKLDNLLGSEHVHPGATRNMLASLYLADYVWGLQNAGCVAHMRMKVPIT